VRKDWPGTYDGQDVPLPNVCLCASKRCCRLDPMLAPRWHQPNNHIELLADLCRILLGLVLPIEILPGSENLKLL